MLLFHCAEWRDVLRLCIVNDGPQATSSILGHRSNKLSRSFWICMDGLKLPMKTFSWVVSKAFSVSLSGDSLPVLLHWSTVQNFLATRWICHFEKTPVTFRVYCCTECVESLSLESLDIVGSDLYWHILLLAFSITWFSTTVYKEQLCAYSLTCCSFKLSKNRWTFLRD